MPISKEIYALRFRQNKFIADPLPTSQDRYDNSLESFFSEEYLPTNLLLMKINVYQIYRKEALNEHSLTVKRKKQ